MIKWLLLSVTILLVGGFFVFAKNFPNVREIEGCMTTSMYKVRLCPGSPQYVRLRDVSPFVIHAIIASEDGAFYSHKGFDWHEIRESLNSNLLSGKFRRGGSTLTQQLTKNVFLTPEKSLWRKAKEAYLTHKIETLYKKDFILEKYLNVVEFGPQLYGIKAAAHHYFGKSPSSLHPLEAAYLAHLLPNPKVYSRTAKAGILTPYSKKATQMILRRMVAFGKLTPEAYETAAHSLDGFPWRHLTQASFEGGPPSYDLETDTPRALPPSTRDEESLEDIVPPAEDEPGDFL